MIFYLGIFKTVEIAEFDGMINNAFQVYRVAGIKSSPARITEKTVIRAGLILILTPSGVSKLSLRLLLNVALQGRDQF